MREGDAMRGDGGEESKNAGRVGAVKRHNGLRKNASLSMYGPEALKHHKVTWDSEDR